MATLKPCFNSHMSLIEFLAKKHPSIFYEIQSGKMAQFNEEKNLCSLNFCFLGSLFWGLYPTVFKAYPGSVPRDHSHQAQGPNGTQTIKLMVSQMQVPLVLAVTLNFFPKKQISGSLITIWSQE